MINKRKLLWGGCPKTSDSNQITFISTDTYKLKVEKTIKGVLGRAGGVSRSPRCRDNPSTGMGIW